MKHLVLMRHAKSDWSAGGHSDFTRPLNPRGRKAATALGQWLRDMDVIPDQVLCSSAARTSETVQRLHLPTDVSSTFTKDLYLASHHDILHALRQATGDVVLVVGHNPGIGNLASGIVAQPPDHPRFDAYPSGATLVAGITCANWKELELGHANARHFVVPRDL